MPEVFNQRKLKNTAGSRLNDDKVMDILIRHRNGEEIDSIYKDYASLISRPGFMKIIRRER